MVIDAHPMMATMINKGTTMRLNSFMTNLKRKKR
jgi:hypothetical protein